MTKNVRNIVLNEADLKFFRMLRVKQLLKVPGIGVTKEPEINPLDMASIFNLDLLDVNSVKGILCYLEAARIVSMHSGNVRFHIFADFDDNPRYYWVELEPYIMLPNIIFHGYVDMPNATRILMF